MCFDLIGDVHGCFVELVEMLHRLGYLDHPDQTAPASLRPVPGRKLIFLGDLVGKGPDSDKVLHIAMRLCKEGLAQWLLGNYDDMLRRYLEGESALRDKLAIPDPVLSRFEQETAAIVPFLAALPYRLEPDENRLMLSHAPVDDALAPLSEVELRHRCIYGSGKKKAATHNLPGNAGKVLQVHGHTPVKAATLEHNKLCLDTGLVYGGLLSALRYPEMQVVTVPAHRQYAPIPAHWKAG